MRAPVRSIQLGSSTNLAVLAPVKPGFVDAQETVTYVERLQRLLDALHASRRNLREAELLEPAFPDTIGRFGVIQNFRYAIWPALQALEDLDDPGPFQLSLNVSFDGGWEPYMRVIKDDTEIDLIVKSVRIQEKALEEVLEDLEPGMTELEVAGRLEASRARSLRVRAWFEEAGDAVCVHRTLLNLAEIERKIGDLASAEARLDAADQLGPPDVLSRAHAVANRGWIARARGVEPEARRLLERAAELAESSGMLAYAQAYRDVTHT